MRLTNFILALLLSLSLVFSALADGMMRAEGGAVATLEICADGGPKTISVDRDGNPVSAHHECMDCCLIGFATASFETLPVWLNFRNHLSVHFDVTRPYLSRFAVKPDARAPPPLI